MRDFNVPVKIYTVEIKSPDPKLWYGKHQGKQYNCILVAKLMRSEFRPRFLVIEKDGAGNFIRPGIMHTIKTTDCEIFCEHLIENASLYTLIGEFSRVAKEV